MHTHNTSLKKRVKVEINRRLHLRPLNLLSGRVVRHLRDRLTFTNPAFLEAEKRGFWSGNLDREIKGYQVDDNTLTMPRGFIRQLLEHLSYHDITYELVDNRRTFPPVDFRFRGELRDFQVEAVEALLSRDFGTLAAPTGSGKTVMALAMIAKRRQPALIVVCTKELQKQWVDRIETFLGIPGEKVGIIGGGKVRVGDKITVALVQSLYKCAGEVAPHVGHLVVDECHRAPSRTFTEAVMAFDCHYMTGLSATPWRRDRLSRLIWWYLGDKVHEVDKEALVDAGHVLEAEVIWRRTNFDSTYDPSEEYSRMLSELTQDRARNALIADDVTREVGNGGGVCLVLSDRKTHCEVLADLLATRGIEAQVLTGDLSNGERVQVVEALNAGRVKVLVATGQLIGEGFDCNQLSTLFLATPIRFNGRLLQYLGRVLRPAPGKGKARVFDYVDGKVGVLEHAARVRARIYNE
jgi:superfamily II DNA or RNA helicase